MNHRLDTDSQIFFYENDFYVFSNFSAFSLEWKGRRFDTSEHVYHWERFEGTGNDSLSESVHCAASAHVAFKLGQDYKQYQRRDWDRIKVDVMRTILLAKIDQHEYVRHKLLASAGRELIEDSWRDSFWGWGPNRDGKNQLGKLWMDIRKDMLTPDGDSDGT